MKMSKTLIIGCGGVASVAIQNVVRLVMYLQKSVLPAVQSQNAIA